MHICNLVYYGFLYWRVIKSVINFCDIECTYLVIMHASLADSDNKPKLETVPWKVNVKKTPSSATAFDVGIYTILQTEDHVCSSWPVWRFSTVAFCWNLVTYWAIPNSACCCLFFHVKVERTLMKDRFLLCHPLSVRLLPYNPIHNNAKRKVLLSRNFLWNSLFGKYVWWCDLLFCL